MTFHGAPSAAWFRGALQAIGRGYRFISAGDIQAYFGGGKHLSGCCHICFDDGERSFVDVAVPVLEEQDIPATLFVSPGVLGSDRNYWFQEVRFLRQQVGDAAIKHEVAALLGWQDETVAPFAVNALLKSLPLTGIWQVIDATRQQFGLPPAPPCNINLDEVRALADHKLVTLGAHTMTHPILQNEAASESERQIRESIVTLAGLTGTPVRFFAYPNGAAGLDYGPREQVTLAACGITLAFATDVGFFGPTTDPLAIPRASLDPGERTTKILSKLLLVPIWDRIRAGSERKARLELKNRIHL